MGISYGLLSFRRVKVDRNPWIWHQSHSHKNSLKSITQNPLGCFSLALETIYCSIDLVAFALLDKLCLNSVSARILSFRNTRTEERLLPGDISKVNRARFVFLLVFFFFSIKQAINWQFVVNMSWGFYRDQSTLSARIDDILLCACLVYLLRIFLPCPSESQTMLWSTTDPNQTAFLPNLFLLHFLPSWTATAV